MSTIKISDLPAITGANTAADDVIPIVDTSLNITNKITRSEFFRNTPDIVVGTTATPASVTIHAPDFNSLNLTTSNASSNVRIHGQGTSTAGLIVSSNNLVAFHTGATTTAVGAEAMRIESSGNLLVGTDILGGAGGLTIAPNNTGGTGTAATAVVWNRNTTTNSSNAVAFRNAGTQVGAISYTNTATTYATSSDYRLKENVAPMQNALDKIAQLNPVTYTWKDGGSAGQGFIAHELQAVVPNCVTGEKDAVDADGNPQYQGVDTSFLVATLVKAIQEQQATIAALEARITALEA